MSEINNTTKMINKLEDEMRKYRRENVILSSVIKETKRKKYINDLINAGQIFEELDILDRYDKEKVIKLLKDNMEHILKIN